MAEIQDKYGRKVNYLRLSITDRCNLRCRYCMPAEGVPEQDHSETLSYEELLHIVTAATELGIRKVRVTGGEPLVRKGALDFIGRLAQLPHIEEVALTTNGLLLEKYAADLKRAGIHTLNVSLDSLEEDTFAAITRGGSLHQVLTGLEKAQSVGLKIKLNMVVMRGVNDQEILKFAELGLENPWSIRFIEYMPTIRETSWRKLLVSGADILALLRQHHQLEELSGSRYCGPAKPYRISGAKGTLGIITPMSDHFCSSCNRIRVTSDGLAKSCLLSERAVDLKPFLQLPVAQLRAILQDVINEKPSQHHFATDERSQCPFSMASIGG